MSSKYRISKESNEWVVSNRAGLILAYFDNKYDAQDYLAAQMRADEQSSVMRAFNESQELRCLVAELRGEL